MSPLDVLTGLQRRADLMLPARRQYTMTATCAVATFVVFGIVDGTPWSEIAVNALIGTALSVPVTAGMRQLSRAPDGAATQERRPSK
ncbi:hypothetical protein [Kitasatospora cineracea]|uniref:hypothetical protein n=1 Tax=Kitasatospora cineracea TaxID=88074 RepID=UPI00378A34A1